MLGVKYLYIWFQSYHLVLNSNKSEEANVVSDRVGSYTGSLFDQTSPQCTVVASRLVGAHQKVFICGVFCRRNAVGMFLHLRVS